MGAEPHPSSSPGARRRSLAAGAALAALLLSACAGPQDRAGDDGSTGVGPTSGAVSTSTGATPDGAGEDSDDGAGEASAAGLELGDRLDQRMSEAAALRAATFGFDRFLHVSPEDIAAAREDNRARATDAARTRVEPATCKAPLAALDFSPILLDQDEVTRVDVIPQNSAGRGTVEVAILDGQGRQRVERHLQTVNTLLADCRDMDMTVTEDGTATDFRLTTRPADLSEGTPAQSGLVWQRSLASAEDPQLTAQVLTAVTPDAVVMVSFTGQPAVGDKEFTLMAEETLAAALAAG